MESKELKRKAELLRRRLLTLIYQGGTGHTGGDLSVLNLLTVLYNHTLHVDPKNPKMAGRDRFVLSKGHCAEALYVVLCDKASSARKSWRLMASMVRIWADTPTTRFLASRLIRVRLDMV